MRKLIKALVLTFVVLVFGVGTLTTYNYVTGVRNNLVSQYKNEENWKFVLGIKTADKEIEYSVFNPTSEVLSVSLDEQMNNLFD